MRTIAIGGVEVPVIGQGTWRMGEQRGKADEERRAILAGLDAGMTLVDTAEMYGGGSTESFLGEALAGRRDEVFLVSKAYPQNASRTALPRACEASLRRLKTDRLDLYLLHWPGSVPIAETVTAMEALVRTGKVRAWGVSNFDASDMDGLIAAGGERCATNQILYNVTRRGPEFDLAPWLAERRVPLMAYSPVEQGRLPEGGALAEIARSRGVSVAQVALSWLVGQANVVAIPKASNLEHVRENRAAADLVLEPDEREAIDAAFPPPRRKQSLEML